MAILRAFSSFPNEAAIIGRLLAGYSDLEICVTNYAQVKREDFDIVLKTMYRVRGETHRIDIADAFGRHYYEKHGLETEFTMAISSMRYCLKIRNQYAHCIWYDDWSTNLAFINLEEIAKTNTFIKDLSTLTVLHVDVPLLEAQEEYFQYTIMLLEWVNSEVRLLTGRTRTNALQKPVPLKHPRLNNP